MKGESTFVRTHTKDMVVYKSALSWCHSISLPVKHGKLNAYLLSLILFIYCTVGRTNYYLGYSGAVNCELESPELSHVGIR
ncbi:hypothetical protein MKX03_032380, partial [Papaver bracteatum]